MPLLGTVLLAACYMYFIMGPSLRDHSKRKRQKARAKTLKRTQRNLPV